MKATRYVTTIALCLLACDQTSKSSESKALEQPSTPAAKAASSDVVLKYDRIDSEFAFPASKPGQHFHTVNGTGVQTILDTGAKLDVARPAADDQSPSAPPRMRATDLFRAFFTNSTVCKLPAKLEAEIRDRLKKANGDTTGVPPEVIAAIPKQGYDDVGDFYTGTGVDSALLVATVTGDGITESDRNLGLSLPVDLDFFGLIETGMNSYVYSIDCSGYLRMKMTANAGLASLSVEASALGNLDTKASMMAAFGLFPSPVGVALAGPAYAGDKAAESISTDQRQALVLAIDARTHSLPETSSIEAPMFVGLATTATQKTQALQGQASTSGSAGGSFFFGSASFSTGGGVSMSSRVAYSQFDSIVLPAWGTSPKRKIRVALKEVRSAATKVISNARAGGSLDTRGATRILTLRLPASVCRQQWDLYAEGVTASLGSVESAVLAQGQCSFTMSLSKDGADALAKKTLAVRLPALGYSITVAE